MDKNHLKSFEIKGFKKFDGLKIDDIGEFNLIVGDNNSGKTSLLEALLADRDSEKFLSALSDIMFKVKKFSNLTDYFLSYFFDSYTENFRPYFLVKQTRNDNSYDIIKYTKLNDNQFYHLSMKNQEPLNDDDGGAIKYNDYDRNGPYNLNIPYIPFGSLYSHELTRQYSNNIQLYVDKKEKLLESLGHIIEKIKNIEVSASQSINPILLISEKGKNRLSPLATYGDGTVKLFRILLSLFANEHYNRLMIDEIDTGVHYSRLKDFLKSLLLVASDQKKQIFATTHSKECIEYFKEALIETGFENRGRVIRLAETKKGTVAFTMSFKEFENALSAESEIR